MHTKYDIRHIQAYPVIKTSALGLTRDFQEILLKALQILNDVGSH